MFINQKHALNCTHTRGVPKITDKTPQRLLRSLYRLSIQSVAKQPRPRRTHYIYRVRMLACTCKKTRRRRAIGMAGPTYVSSAPRDISHRVFFFRSYRSYSRLRCLRRRRATTYIVICAESEIRGADEKLRDARTCFKEL